jgi:hypothetical protein
LALDVEPTNLPLRVQLFSLPAMLTLGMICILPGARAQNSPNASRIWVTATSVPVVQSPRWKGIRTDAPGQWKPNALQYLQAATSIHLTNSGKQITGTLTGAKGAPISNAEVTLTAADVGARLWPTLRHLSGIVPYPAPSAAAVAAIQVSRV